MMSETRANDASRKRSDLYKSNVHIFIHSYIHSTHDTPDPGSGKIAMKEGRDGLVMLRDLVQGLAARLARPLKTYFFLSTSTSASNFINIGDGQSMVMSDFILKLVGIA